MLIRFKLIKRGGDYVIRKVFGNNSFWGIYMDLREAKRGKLEFNSSVYSSNRGSLKDVKEACEGLGIKYLRID